MSLAYLLIQDAVLSSIRVGSDPTWTASGLNQDFRQVSTSATAATIPYIHIGCHAFVTTPCGVGKKGQLP